MLFKLFFLDRNTILRLIRIFLSFTWVSLNKVFFYLIYFWNMNSWIIGNVIKRWLYPSFLKANNKN